MDISGLVTEMESLWFIMELNYLLIIMLASTMLTLHSIPTFPVNWEAIFPADLYRATTTAWPHALRAIATAILVEDFHTSWVNSFVASEMTGLS